MSEIDQPPRRTRDARLMHARVLDHFVILLFRAQDL